MDIITFTPGESSRYYKDRLPHLKQTGAQWSCGCPMHPTSTALQAGSPLRGPPAFVALV